MNLNDQSHLYFIFDLTPLPLRFHNNKSPVRRGNERNPDVDERQQHFVIVTTNIGMPCGENLAFLYSAPLLTSALAFSVNNDESLADLCSRRGQACPKICPRRTGPRKVRGKITACPARRGLLLSGKNARPPLAVASPIGLCRARNILHENSRHTRLK